MVCSFFQHQRGVNIYSAFEISEFSRPTFITDVKAKIVSKQGVYLVQKLNVYCIKNIKTFVGTRNTKLHILHIEIQGTGIMMLKILLIIGIFAASSTASSEGSIREGKLNCQPIKGEIFSY